MMTEATTLTYSRAPVPRPLSAKVLCCLALVGLLGYSGSDRAAEAPPVATWQEAMLRLCRDENSPGSDAAAVALARGTAVLAGLGEGDFTVTCWIRSRRDGVVIAKCLAEGAWRPQDKALFVRDGRLCFDVGWVGCVTGSTPLTDGNWHHVGLVYERAAGRQALFVDGRLDASGTLTMGAEQEGAVFKVGRGAANFPETTTYEGAIDEIRVVAGALMPEQVLTAAGMAGGSPVPDPTLFLSLDAPDAAGMDLFTMQGTVAFEAGHTGSCLVLDGQSALRTRGAPLAVAWDTVRHVFPDARSREEMAWEQEDGIWHVDCTVPELATGYARAVARRCPILTPLAQAHAARSVDEAGLRVMRDLYLICRRRGPAMATLSPAALRRRITAMAARFPDMTRTAGHLARLDGLEARQTAWTSAVPSAAEIQSWVASLDALARECLIRANPALGFGKILYVRRFTYDANHYYTEYINSTWTPGGGLSVLDVTDGSVTDLLPDMSSGVFERFDLSFDARHIVFAWKAGPQVGYRIYEVDVDGRNLRQLTFPVPDEDELVRAYRVDPKYHHGTDDMQPCYLPDGGIAFISSRCQYGILCDAPDNFTTTTLYRMDADGGNMRRLSNSSVSEASPVVMADGRILYTRWEYVDKGAVSVKCLWAMRPDGSASAEVYGNDIALPPTLIYGRPIPDNPSLFVVLGTPHCPQNGVGTVIRLNTTRDTRSRHPMTYMTPHVDIQAEGGFAFRDQTPDWQNDGAGRGPLFKDPYPLGSDLFLVAHKPRGPEWSNPKAYGLALLDESGAVYPLHTDPDISCWLPYPVRPRRRPPVLPSALNPELAAQGKALCVVSDVYAGLEEVERGTIKHIRVLEQVPRPWAARRRWGGDEYDQQHVCISKDTHLGLKVQHGVVPVEADGSACFIVPAEANIILQVLDGDFMAVQTERTFVDYAPGEVRGCVGCHERPVDTATSSRLSPLLALNRPPSLPGPQPGEVSGARPLDYLTDVQPVWDRACLSCHGETKREGDLDLRGTPTERFCVSYEQLVPERRRGSHDRGLLGPVIGENHPKTGNVDYLPAGSLGSHASVLVAMLSRGKVHVVDPVQATRAAKLSEAHKEIRLSPEDLLKVTTWVDTNCQFYGSYWGKRNLASKNDPTFRPVPTFQQALSRTPPPGF